MLATLSKYEFKAVGRILLPLYGALIVVSVMFGLSLNLETRMDGGTLSLITGILYAFVMTGAVIITTIILVQRFYKNLLGNEGYFMFALPVSTGKHITNKVISGSVWMFIGLVAAVISGIAIVICVEGIRPIFEEFGIFINGINLLTASEWFNVITIILEAIIIVLAGCAMTVTKVYAAISIGHQWGNHRVMGAILAYIGIGVAESVVVNIMNMRIMINVLGLFEGLIEKLPMMVQTHMIMWGVIAILAVVTAIYWLVSWVLLDNKLNLE